MKKLFCLVTIILFTGVVLISSAQATQWAIGVDSYDLGNSSTEPGRTNPSNALGSPDNLFLSLGYDQGGVGGWAIFDFGTLFHSEAVIVETTGGNPNNWKEYADIYVSSSVDPFTFLFAANIDNFSGNNTVDLSLVAGHPFRYLKIVDTTFGKLGHAGDGFDVNAVGVNPVPEPATMVLFGIGLLGLAGAIRKKRP